MKKSDIISIVMVAMIGTFAAAFIVNLIMGNPDDAKASFKDIEVVNADLAEPNPEVFNSDAINPTIEVYVGSCVDVDQDGSLSQAELVACGRIDGTETEEESTEDAETNNNTEDKNNQKDDSTKEDVVVEETVIDKDEEDGASNSRNTR